MYHVPGPFVLISIVFPGTVNYSIYIGVLSVREQNAQNTLLNLICAYLGPKSVSVSPSGSLFMMQLHTEAAQPR